MSVFDLFAKVSHYYLKNVGRSLCYFFFFFNTIISIEMNYIVLAPDENEQRVILTARRCWFFVNKCRVSI